MRVGVGGRAGEVGAGQGGEEAAEDGYVGGRDGGAGGIRAIGGGEDDVNEDLRREAAVEDGRLEEP